MFKRIPIYLILLFFASNLLGQNIDMDQAVHLDYRNVRIGDALEDITNTYSVRFSYSKHYVPVEQRVDLLVEGEPLYVALDYLFDETEVVYANIGNQIVLKKGKQANSSMRYGVIKPPIRAIDQNKEPVLTASNNPYGEIEAIPILEKYDYGLPEVFSEKPEEEFDSKKYYVLAPTPEPDILSNTIAQVSLVPHIGTNQDDAKETTNNISLNVFGGENGGVNGLEIGGLFNKVENDVKGVQIAGLFNAVGGDVGPSTLIDGNEKKSFGVQIAGLVNVASNVHAVQYAGLLNLNKGSFRGAQFAFIGNRNGGDAQGFQFGGIFNVNNGDGGVQIAGLSNVAKNVEGTQISALFNKADDVKGSQFALINVCDTVSGASIGLLNFVKKGYNQIELGGSETMHGQLAIRFGSRRFYNIFQGGIRFDDINDYKIGYGIGTSIYFQNSKRWQWNTELVASQIIENNVWFEHLNILGELRFTFEYKMSRWASFYFGPTANLMLTKIIDSETMKGSLPNSEIPPYTLFDNKIGIEQTLDIKSWIGFRAGFRFGRN